MVSLLFDTTATVIERTGEDANGHVTTRTTTHDAAYVEITDADSPGHEGVGTGDTALVALDPAGYGSTWEIKPGDTVTARGDTLTAHEVQVLWNPRLHEYSHVEVRCG